MLNMHFIDSLESSSKVTLPCLDPCDAHQTLQQVIPFTSDPLHMPQVC